MSGPKKPTLLQFNDSPDKARIEKLIRLMPLIKEESEVLAQAKFIQYESLLKAGFDKEQSLQIVIAGF